jgi:HPt (histidine-containing phosphotransfer) domain-containing protein
MIQREHDWLKVKGPHVSRPVPNSAGGNAGIRLRLPRRGGAAKCFLLIKMVKRPAEGVSLDTPMDHEWGAANLGSADNFFNLVSKYEGMALISDLEKAAKAMDEENWLELRNAIHSIKGSSAYAGAGRLSDVCYYMQAHYEADEISEMVALYPKFIEKAIEF